MARMRALLLLFKCRFGVRPAGFRRRDEGVKDGEPDPWPSRSGSAGTRRWFLRLVVVGMGILVGVGVFTFGYADGAAYLSSDPAVCTNCHVMRENYDGWVKSSHGKVAVCNDCHAPHDAIGKWTTKAVNGLEPLSRLHHRAVGEFRRSSPLPWTRFRLKRRWEDRA